MPLPIRATLCRSGRDHVQVPDSVEKKGLQARSRGICQQFIFSVTPNAMLSKVWCIFLQLHLSSVQVHCDLLHVHIPSSTTQEAGEKKSECPRFGELMYIC